MPRLAPALRRQRLALAALLVLPAAAHAASPVFGPVEYVRATGAPTTVTAQFPACRPERPFHLRLDNGPRGLTRVSSAALTLNGTEIVAPSQLNQQVASLERAVALRPDNTLVLTLAGTPRGTLAVAITSDLGCGPEITLATPGAGVPTGPLLVRGTVRTAAPEVGVTVNGLPAAVHGPDFLALVPVDPDVTELVAVATLPDGTTAEARQPLTVVPPTGPALLFRPSPEVGVAPLPVTFTLLSPGAVTEVALDLDGDGVVDFRGPTLDEQRFVYDRPGLYQPTVTVTDPEGGNRTAAALVAVVDPGALDGLLQAKWVGLKDALRRGDVTTALASLARSVRERYQELLDHLTVPLSQIDGVLTSLQVVSLDGHRAEYQMLRTDAGGSLSYFVLFVRDIDGVWRLKFF